MLEHQQSAASNGYLTTEPSIYPTTVNSVVSTSSKTSPSRYQCNDLASQYDQTTLNASQRRHAFGAYRNLRGSNSGVSVAGGSTSIESFAESPNGPSGSGNVLSDSYGRGRSLANDVIDYSQSYHDPNRLAVPLSSDFVTSGSRLHFRHHSYDVPPPPPAPDDDGVRRRTLATIGRIHHSFDSAPNNVFNRRQTDYDEQGVTSNWHGRQNVGGGGNFFDNRRSAENVEYFDRHRSDSRYRSASYVDAMASSYHGNDLTGRTQYQPPLSQQQQQQFRHSDSLVGERQHHSPHFHRRHTEEAYEPYGQPHQQQQQQQSQQLYSSSYDHYYSNNSSSRLLLTNCDDRMQPSFSDYPARELFYNGTSSQENNRMTDTAGGMKAKDNHIETNPGYYENSFNNHAPYPNDVSNFTSVVPVTSQSAMTSSVTTSVLPPASQIYPNETMNITSNKSYWEWNNNGYANNSASATYNGGIRRSDLFGIGTKQFNSGYPDVLQKNSHSGYSVSRIFSISQVVPSHGNKLKLFPQF